MIQNTFLSNLNAFFSNPAKHQFIEKIVFAPGTAPMRKQNSEVADILFATDFDVAYFVDPVYDVAGADSPLAWDIEALDSIADQIPSPYPLQWRGNSKNLLQLKGVSFSPPVEGCPTGGECIEAVYKFNYHNRQRTITFIAGDATLPENQPEDFNIFFSGKRIGLYPGVGLRGTPSEYLPNIVKKLSSGGYLIPDRDLLDDAVYFLVPPQELGLTEVPGIRVPIPRSEFTEGYSEGKRFVHGDVAPGIGLYRKE